MSGRVWFFPGLHQPADTQHFDLACVSINRLRGRKKPLACRHAIVDSGAFTELERYGHYRHGVEEYAAELRRLDEDGIVPVAIAVAQDYMCEPWMLEKTGLTIADHQRLTIERYDELLDCGLPCPIMPVLQGYDPQDYADHLDAYGSRLRFGAWVGVGSVCKRQGDPTLIVRVLEAVLAKRPDLRIHGFGVKTTALLHPGVRSRLYSADSMAWSFAARKQGRNANDWREARLFTDRINAWTPPPAPAQKELFAA